MTIHLFNSPLSRQTTVVKIVLRRGAKSGNRQLETHSPLYATWAQASLLKDELGTHPSEGDCKQVGGHSVHSRTFQCG